MTAVVKRKVAGSVKAAIAAAGLLAIPSLANAADETYSLFTTIAISGLTSFDISWVDAAVGTYFLADRSNKSVDAINTTTKGLQFILPGGFVGAVVQNGAVNNNLSGPDGLLTLKMREMETRPKFGLAMVQALLQAAPHRRRGRVTCSTTKVIDFASGQLTHTIPTNGVARADELCFDPKHHVVLMANDADNPPFITEISTDTYKVINYLLIPEATNGIEQCQWDKSAGLFFLNIPEVNGPGDDTADGAVYAIDAVSFQVVAKYIIPTSVCAGPQGMAIGPEPQLLLGCNAPSPNGVRSSVIINKHTGAVLAQAWGLGGADEVWFNPGDSHYYITGSSVTPPQLGIVDGTGAGAVDQIITIAKIGAVSPHSVAADPATGNVYWPNAGGVNIFAHSALDSDDPVTAGIPPN